MSGHSGDAIRGVVLAGGRSTRFDGGDKALAELDGRPLLRRVLDALRAATDGPPLVVVRDPDRADDLAAALDLERGRQYEFARDSPAFRGPVAGLFGALETVDDPWLFATACDMPLLDPDAVADVCSRRADGTGAVVPRSDGGIEPLHAAYRREALADVRDGVASEAGLHAVVGEIDAVTFVDAEASPTRLEDSVRNVNTVADLEALAARSNGPDR